MIDEIWSFLPFSFSIFALCLAGAFLTFATLSAFERMTFQFRCEVNYRHGIVKSRRKGDQVAGQEKHVFPKRLNRVRFCISNNSRGPVRVEIGRSPGSHINHFCHVSGLTRGKTSNHSNTGS